VFDNLDCSEIEAPPVCSKSGNPFFLTSQIAIANSFLSSIGNRTGGLSWPCCADGSTVAESGQDEIAFRVSGFLIFDLPHGNEDHNVTVDPVSIIGHPLFLAFPGPLGPF
jgi:hypothetical protein